VTTRKRRNSKFEWESAFIRSGHTGNTGFIGLLMATYDNGDGRGFFMSANQAEALTGLNEKTIRVHIGKLVETGWLKVTQRGGNQGGVARASRYELTIPAASQPGDVIAQPGNAASQPDGSTQVVDQDTLDPLSLDQSSPEPQKGYPDLKPGDEYPTFLVEKMDKEVRDHFYPSFERDGIMVYSAERVVPSTPAAPATPSERAEDTRSLDRQRAAYARQMREEGFDENGQPLDRSAPKNSSSRRRRSH
jgi:hypothetical protein